MKSILPIILVLVLLGVLVLFLKMRAQKESAGVWPYNARPQVLTAPEQILYHRLVQALPEQIVLAQVQVSRVLVVKKGLSASERTSWTNKIDRLSYDFVVCAKDSKVLAVIELDDRSHERADRAKTDQKKDKATADAGVRMIRWKTKDLPDVQTIQAALAPPSVVARGNPRPAAVPA